MQREPARLRRAAERVQEDLRRTTGAPWRVAVGDDLVLSVDDGRRAEHVLLEAEIEDEAWFRPPGLDEAEADSLLDADADEVVAGETIEVLRVLDVRWPVCADHGTRLDVCTGWWYCEGPRFHDVAEVGRLGAEG